MHWHTGLTFRHCGWLSLPNFCVKKFKRGHAAAVLSIPRLNGIVCTLFSTSTGRSPDYLNSVYALSHLTQNCWVTERHDIMCAVKHASERCKSDCWKGQWSLYVNSGGSVYQPPIRELGSSRCQGRRLSTRLQRTWRPKTTLLRSLTSQLTRSTKAKSLNNGNPWQSSPRYPLLLLSSSLHLQNMR